MPDKYRANKKFNEIQFVRKFVKQYNVLQCNIRLFYITYKYNFYSNERKIYFSAKPLAWLMLLIRYYIYYTRQYNYIYVSSRGYCLTMQLFWQENINYSRKRSVEILLTSVEVYFICMRTYLLQRTEIYLKNHQIILFRYLEHNNTLHSLHSQSWNSFPKISKKK